VYGEEGAKLNLRMSDLKTAQRCLKKFDFSYVRGWEPKSQPGTWHEGTWVHEWLRAGYENLAMSLPFFDASNAPKFPEDMEDQERFLNAERIVHYYWDQVGQHDNFPNILSVEQPVVVPIGVNTISCTFDLVVKQENGQVVVYDHKTVGDVNQTLEFLPIDIQAMTYLWAANTTYGQDAVFVYNMIRRKVPPPLESKSKASRDPHDYLRRVSLWKSPEEIKLIQDELWRVIYNLQKALYTRSPIKNGGEACSFCPYLSVCTAELAGMDVNSVARLLYR